MTDEEVATKFRALAGRKLPETHAADALKRLWNVDQEAGAGIVFDVLCVS